MRIPPCLVSSFALTTPAFLSAQANSPALGVQGTAAYALIWNRTGAATDPPFTPLTGRFNGRIAVQVGANAYVGVSAGSWGYAADDGSYSSTTGQLAAAVASAVVTTAFAQFYPIERGPFFVRGGVGYAVTRTYTPTMIAELPAPLIEESHGRLAVTAGAGFDIPLHRRLALTLSADYTKLSGVSTGFESTSAVQLGVGLTVR